MPSDPELPPCSTCGRAAHDWTARPEGVKGRQRSDTEDRALAYRQWHYTLPAHCWLSDVDGIEWRLVDGQPVPAAIIELSRIDGALPLPASYLRAVETRFFDRDAQGSLIRRTAEILGVPAYLVLFARDLSAFYILDLGRRRWAKPLTRAAYGHWLQGLQPPKLSPQTPL